MATNGMSSLSDQFSTTSNSSNPAADQSSANRDLSKDEVAWFFVEQYYTTLSKNPEKLHLFYGKRSQFVYGREAEVANVSVGRQTIQERIKALDLQDCKVRVSNVDSQATFESIVIQVIGETSNKAADPKKFVQTFVLAQQPSGYFVLNDILRYINEDGDEEPAESSTQPPASSAAELATGSDDAPAQESKPAEPAPADEPATVDTGAVDQKLENVAKEEPSAKVEATTVVPDETPASVQPTATETDSGPDPETTAKELAEEDSKQPERPADPTPTPNKAAQAAAPAAAPAPAPTGPPKPMTWASRAAAAAGPRPAVALPKTATPPATQSRPAPAAAPASAAAPAAAPAAEPAAAAAPAKEASTEWQTAGSDSKRQNRPQSISGAPAEKEGTLGYVKYVTENVKNEELKAALAQHGELVYFDINRQKNCAFVEFASPAGYQAAAAASPITVNGEKITVEARRPKAGAYGGANYSQPRGAPANRGGQRFEGTRSGSQGGGRGNLGQNRGRGGAAARGRGGAQAANA